MDGVTTLGGQFTDYGIVSTPQLHYFVACKNSHHAYGEPTEEGYFKKLATAFKGLRGASSDNGSYKHQVMLDGANGVGALKMKKLQEYLGDSLEVAVFNSGDGKLNYLCGADHVKVQQNLPEVIKLHSIINLNTHHYNNILSRTFL